MSETLIYVLWILFGFYISGLCIIWLIIAIDEGDFLLPYFNKHNRWTDKLTKDEWFKVIWITLCWPGIFIYKLIFNWSRPIFKFLLQTIAYIFEFIVFPFKLLFNRFHKQKNIEKEPLKYRIAKWIVKKFKL